MANNYVDSNLVPVSVSELLPGQLALKIGSRYITGLLYGGSADGGTGSITIPAGADISSMTVSGCGLEITSGATVTSTAVSGGGTLVISSGGSANGTIVNPGGSMTVSNGGTASGTVENGGYVNSEGGADVSFASHTFSGVVVSNASATVHSGTTADSASVNNGGTIIIYSGGSANSTTVNAGGTVNVSSGGTANSTTVNSSGSMTISGGGSATMTNAESGASVTVSSGGSAEIVAVYGSSAVTVSSGGFVSGTVVPDGGSIEILSGGTANDTTVLSGGTANIGPDAYVSGLTLSSGASQTISSGASAVSVNVGPGAELYVSEGGNITNALAVHPGGTAYLPVGTVIPSIVSASGAMIVYYGGQAVLMDAQRETVSSAAVLSGVAVSSGWSGYAANGGVQNAPDVLSGGTMLAYGSGTVSAATVHPGGTLAALAGGAISSGVVSSGGSVFVAGKYDTFETDAQILGTVLESGAVLNGITLNAEASPAKSFGAGLNYSSGIVSSGDCGTIFRGDNVSSITVEPGAELNVYGTLSGGVVSSGGLLSLHNSSTAAYAQVLSGGTIYTSDNPLVSGYANFSGGTLESGVHIGSTLVTASSSADASLHFYGSDLICEGDVYEVPSFVTIENLELENKRLRISGYVDYLRMSGDCQLEVLDGGYLTGDNVHTNSRTVIRNGGISYLHLYTGADVLLEGTTYVDQLEVHGIYSTHIPAVRITGPTTGNITLIGESAGGLSESLYCFASASFDSMTVSSAAVMMSPWASSANYIQMAGGLLQMTGGTVTEWVWDSASSRHVSSSVVRTPHLSVIDAFAGTVTVSSASIGYGIIYGDVMNILDGGTVGTNNTPLEIAGGTVTVFTGGTVYYSGNPPVDSGGTIISAGE